MRTNLYLKYTVKMLFSVGTILGRFDQSAVGSEVHIPVVCKLSLSSSET